MRYAFISDIHANLQAWKAVHIDIRANKTDYIICLGDLIGYGPSPAELLDDVHTHVDAFVIGNHDAVACGRMDASSFTPEARNLIEWTGKRLNRRATAFLQSLPLTIVGNGFRCAHADFANPARFDYVLNMEEAVPSWQANDAPILFAGHTHDPALFSLDPQGSPAQLPTHETKLQSGVRYFANVGSVGCPRDGDPRACYCLYDTTTQILQWRRIPFDLAGYRTILIQAGLDPAKSHLLKNDPLAQAVPLRARLDFSPPRSIEKVATNVIAEKEFINMRRSIHRWRLLSLATLLMGCALVMAWFFLEHSTTHRRKTPKRKASMTTETLAVPIPLIAKPEPTTRRRRSATPTSRAV